MPSDEISAGGTRDLRATSRARRHARPVRQLLSGLQARDGRLRRRHRRRPPVRSRHGDALPDLPRPALARAADVAPPAPDRRRGARRAGRRDDGGHRCRQLDARRARPRSGADRCGRRGGARRSRAADPCRRSPGSASGWPASPSSRASSPRASPVRGGPSPSCSSPSSSSPHTPCRCADEAARIDAGAVAVVTSIGACIVTLPLIALDAAHDRVVQGDLHASSVAVVLYIGVGSGIAYFLFAHVLSRLPASRFAVAMYAVPTIGVLASWAVLGERPTGRRHRGRRHDPWRRLGGRTPPRRTRRRPGVTALPPVRVSEPADGRT